MKECQLIMLEGMTDIFKSPFYTHHGNNRFRQEPPVDAKSLGIRTVRWYHSISLQLTNRIGEGAFRKEKSGRHRLHQIIKFNMTTKHI